MINLPRLILNPAAAASAAKDCLRWTSRKVGIFTTHPQANGKTVVGVMPVDFCPFCGEAIETCRVKWA